jgi:5-formyltetrahydrofolate cyclo-ligase
MDASDERLLTEKQDLRRKMSAAREALPPDARRDAVRAACDRVAGLDELNALWSRPTGAAPVVAGYVAVPAKSELDPEPFLTWLRGKGGRVVLPRVARASVPRLRFHESAPDELRFGAYGLLEPDAAAPEVLPADIDLILVPGLAFDDKGRRLGWGGGYYDELLRCLDAEKPGAGTSLRRPCLVGIAYDFQVVESCPAGAADRGVDLVVTDRRVVRRPLEVS